MISSPRLPLYTKQEWRMAAFLFAAQIATSIARVYLLPAGLMLFPSSAISLAGLFFGGLRLWPVVFAATLVGGLIGELPLPSLIMFTVGQTVQAVIAAYLLRSVRMDPLFRRFKDTFFFLLTAVLTSLILPALIVVGKVAGGMAFTSEVFAQAYLAMLASQLVLAPFLLRWLAKPRFSRTVAEWIELAAVFALLVGIGVALFLYHIDTFLGIQMLYFLVIPFFWIALRHRPRWVSAALLITAGLAIAGEVNIGDPASLAARLYEIEALLVTLGMSFFIIVSIEEDRRVSTNIMRSQMSTLENAVARVSSESSAKNDFIAILAHELRNPLAPIASSIDLMKLKGPRDEEERGMLATMEDRMDTVKRLLDDLLDISRISEGKVALKQEVLDLEDCIRRAVVSTEHHIKERHQSLVLQFPKKRKYVLGDAVRLEQVFSNLLTNASKYSNSGDTITLAMKRIDQQIEVSVSDEGVGIRAEDLASIFTPFHQIEQGARSRKGLGIGLALVRSFIEMHGGTVYAQSAGAGKGSQFFVRLPLLPDANPQVPSSAKEPERIAATKTAGLSVLVVDDNDAAAAGIGRLLELRGCTVSYAYDGGQAVERVAEVAPGVVILDVGLPDQDGYSIAKILRARGYKGRLIALTGFSTDDARDKGGAAGFDHYLVKPAGFNELKQVIPELA